MDSAARKQTYLRRNEAQKCLGCGTTKLYQLLGNGHIRGKRSGKTLLIEATSVDSYLASLPDWKPARSAA